MVPSLFVVPDVSVKVIVGETELPVTDEDADAKQAVVELVTVTVYDVVELGETTLLFPLALIGAGQEEVIPLVGLAVSVTLSPLHIIPSSFVVPDVSLKVMVGLGNVLTVTDVEVDAEQAVVELVTVTA